MPILHARLTKSVADDDYLSMNATADLFEIDPFALVALDLNHSEGDLFPESYETTWPDGRTDFGWLYSEIKKFKIDMMEQNFIDNLTEFDKVRLPQFVSNEDFCPVDANVGEKDFWISRDVLYHTLKFDPLDQTKANQVAGRDFPAPQVVRINEDQGPVERWLDSEVQEFCRNATPVDLTQLSAQELFDMIMDELP